MLKLASIGAAAAAAAVLVSAAHAGPAATDSNGNVSVVDIGLSPPLAGTRAKPVGAKVTFQEFFGNRNGQPLPRVTRTVIEVPKGTRNNGRLFAKCPLPRTPEELGSKRCKRAARIGSGTVEADARPTIEEPLVGDLTVYNGGLRHGNPTLVLLADVKLGTGKVSGELDFEMRGTKLTSIDPPKGTPQGLFTITKVDVVLGKTVRLRRGGKRVRVSLFETPTVCRRGTWRSSSTQTFEGGGHLTAHDTAPCVAAH
jgi:hypothetical protein